MGRNIRQSQCLAIYGDDGIPAIIRANHIPQGFPIWNTKIRQINLIFRRIEIGDGIFTGSFTKDKGICTFAAGQNVIAVTTIKRIVTRPANKGIYAV